MKRKKTKDFHSPTVQIKSSPPRYYGLFIEILAVLILAGIPFGMGKFFEFNQPDPFDGGAYAYSAWHLHQGGKLNVDEFSAARPGTLLANYLGVVMFGYSELGPEIIQMILQLASLGIMFYTLRRCFGKVAAVLCTTLASIYLSAPLIAKFGNVKEQFMIPFMIASACFLMLAIQTQRKRFWISVGACVVWPFYFKPVGLSIFFAAGILVILPAIFRRQALRQAAIRLLMLSAGAIAGIIPLAVFFIWQDCLREIVYTTPVYFIKLSVVIAIVILVIPSLFDFWKKADITNKLKTVHKRYWIIGAGGFVAAYLIGTGTVYFQRDAIQGDVAGYLDATPFVALPVHSYTFLENFLSRFWTSLGTQDFYVTSSRKLMGFKEQAPIVFRYCRILNLPILFALVSTAAGLIHLILQWKKKSWKLEAPEQILLLLASWWLIDMAFIWISPRSYEQYYLPMCASAAMLGGYGIWRFMEHLNPVRSITGRFLAPAALLVMTALVWPILAGITHSPFSGQAYGQRSRGYVQSWESTRAKLRENEVDPWEQLSDYIRTHSGSDDRIYVWGWYPGIYVRAQRLSASSQAFEGNMHIMPPTSLSITVRQILGGFSRHSPRFIADGRKREFPWNVPPLELWPEWILPPQNQLRIPKEMEGQYRGFLSTEKNKIDKYESKYSSFLANDSPEEAERFEAMKPFRDYVMQNYKVIGVFGSHVLFERIHSAGTP